MAYPGWAASVALLPPFSQRAQAHPPRAIGQVAWRRISVGPARKQRNDLEGEKPLSRDWPALGSFAVGISHLPAPIRSSSGTSRLGYGHVYHLVARERCGLVDQPMIREVAMRPDDELLGVVVHSGLVLARGADVVAALRRITAFPAGLSLDAVVVARNVRAEAACRRERAVAAQQEAGS